MHSVHISQSSTIVFYQLFTAAFLGNHSVVDLLFSFFFDPHSNLKKSRLFILRRGPHYSFVFAEKRWICSFNAHQIL